MKVTNIDLFIQNYPNQPQLKGFVSITLDNLLVIHKARIVEGNNGLFVSMPSRRADDKSWHDIVHPIKKELRQHIEAEVLLAYRQRCIERENESS